jgi:hypothetical protein
MESLCELVRLNDLERLYRVKHALEARGVWAEIWGDGWACRMRYARANPELRLMVRRRDLVCARWVAHAAGLDTWPDGHDEDNGI